MGIISTEILKRKKVCIFYTIGSSLGWESVFYLGGVLSLLWVVVWMWCISDTPEHHPTISQEEKTFILDSQRATVERCKDSKGGDVRIPWVAIFTSVRVWAILVAHFCHNWLFYLILTDLPTYLKQVLLWGLNYAGI